MNYTEKSGLSGSVLKWIAILTMLVDHTGAVFLEYGLLPKVAKSVLAGHSMDYLVEDYHFWVSVNFILRSVGRLAFPIFCFLLVEGFLYTKDVKKYALRLGVFALISEIPFDLAFNKSVLELSYQNVFFTLLIGLLVLWGTDSIKKKLPDHLVLLQYLVPVFGILLAEFLQTDYSGFGVLLIFLLYEFRNNRQLQCILGAAYTLFNSLTACISFLFIWMYNGKRGKQLPKYFFYAFYPAHLLLLFVLRQLIQ